MYREVAAQYSDVVETIRENLLKLEKLMETDQFIDWVTDTNVSVDEGPGFRSYAEFMNFMYALSDTYLTQSEVAGEIQSQLDELVADGLVNVGLNESGEMVYWTNKAAAAPERSNKLEEQE